MRHFLTVLAISFLMAACATSNTVLMSEIEDIGLDTREQEEGVVVEVPSVFFEFGQYKLSDAGRTATGKLADIMNSGSFANRDISIGGHTDGIGEPEANLSLSLKRAESVYEQLVFSRIEEKRIKAVEGFGETQPLQPNTFPDGSDNEAGRAANRRVEVLIEN